VHGGDESAGGGIEAQTVTHGEGATFALGETRVTVRSVPCHTRGHVLYCLSSGADDSAAAPQPGAVLTGDTLFVGGCGRFFEGDTAEMRRNLVDVIGTMPPATELFVGHEYTVSNLKFAASVEPGNADVAERLAWAERTTAAGGATTPTTVAWELRTNPFMRLDVPEIRAAVGCAPGDDPVKVMAALRELKNKG
jgi:hydroxyacylglutathione hydrolase